MFKLLIYFLIIFYFCFASHNNKFVSDDEIISRKKRWLIFPKGSSLQLVYCFLYSTYGTKPGIFVIGFTVGLAWEIPVDLREYVYKNGKEQLNVRDRRQIFRKIEIFLDRIGHHGRYCVLNSICTVNKLKNESLTLIESILHAVFSMGDIKHWLEDQDHEYKFAGSQQNHCDAIFPCNLTLFHKHPP